jgi:hypothetical protein
MAQSLHALQPSIATDKPKSNFRTRFPHMKLKELITAAALPPILLALLTLFSISM